MSATLLQAEVERAPDAARASRIPILAFASDPESESVLRDSLASELAEGGEIRRGNLAEASRVLRRSASPMVLLVDISGSDQPLSELGELSQLVEPDVRVLVIGERADLALYRGLTQGLGVLEYLFKPLTREMVASHFGALIARQARGPRLLRGGRVITVTGVHGGVGATTIAANLAWYIAERARRPTLLLDGDLYGGAAGLLLSAKPSPGLRVALEKPDRIDDLFIDRAAQTIGERLQVLSGEGRLTEPPHVAEGALARLMEVLRRRFMFLICDAPWPASAVGSELVELAHQRVLVTDPSVAGARDALRYLAMTPSGVSAGRLAGNAATAAPATPPPLIVLNQAGMPGGIATGAFEQAIGREADLVIPFMKGALRGSANLGEPAAATNPRFRQLVADLAYRAGSVAEARAQGRRLWRRR